MSTTNVNTASRKPLVITEPNNTVPFDTNISKEEIIEDQAPKELGELVDSNKQSELSEEEKALAQPAPEQTSKFLTEMKEIIVEINEGKVADIKEKLKEGIIRLEYVNEKGQLKEDLREYIPLTIGKNKKVVKAMKRIKLLRAELENKNFVIEDLKLKYPEIIPDDTTKEDMDEGTDTMREEIIGNYIIETKARIYFDITDIENYTVNDLIILISLYELRNSATPY